ncbi:MAG: lamin tail domain-containing protein, partial [bacterium]|nr:lamin tail domain-containing protein [bacterium]
MSFRSIRTALVLTGALALVTTAALAVDTTNVLDGGIAINEFLPDPSDGLSCDTDGGGTAEDEDEFVELYNLSGSTIDIGGFELWDLGVDLWFTFPGGTMVAPGGFALVVVGVQGGGALPVVAAGSVAFDAGRTSPVLNNGGDNVVVYDPGADEYIQALYNGDGAD